MPLRGFFAPAVIAGVLMVGCGESNLFSGTGDEGSKQGKLEEAQRALDKGKCEKAVELFTDLQVPDEDPNSVDRRLDLSAAYMCKAGFSLTTFVEVAADLGSGAVTQDNLFKAVIDKTVERRSPTWETDVAGAKNLLGVVDQTGTLQRDATGSLLIFKNDPDAAFNLSIVSMASGALYVANVISIISNSQTCVESATARGLPAEQIAAECNITSDNALELFNSVLDASDVLDVIPGVSPDIQDTIDGAKDGIILQDGSGGVPADGKVDAGELGNYLLSQGILPSSQAETTCADGYKYDSATNKYTFTGQPCPTK